MIGLKSKIKNIQKNMKNRTQVGKGPRGFATRVCGLLFKSPGIMALQTKKKVFTKG